MGPRAIHRSDAPSEIAEFLDGPRTRRIAVGTTRAPNLPQGIYATDPLARYWDRRVADLIHVESDPALQDDAMRERHRIYALLLMALIFRFWNGNNNGPTGIYPYREKQKARAQNADSDSFRYEGDLNVSACGSPIKWDRYIGHNIACLAVDGEGQIIDFDFNHNDFFRSSAEHAESRMVRRIFSLSNLKDAWSQKHLIPGKTPAFALKDVTIYTSLESCAQCSGVMSLGRIKQVVYLQNDPGAYRIGNIMYNLAGIEDPAHGGGRLLARSAPNLGT